MTEPSPPVDGHTTPATADPGRPPAPGTPRWVKVFLVVAAVVVVVFVIVHLAGGGMENHLP